MDFMYSGVVINIIIFFNVIVGTYEKRGHYEMVEKVGLYWHFVDLVGLCFYIFLFGVSSEYGERGTKLEIFRGLIKFKSNVQKIWEFYLYFQ